MLYVAAAASEFAGLLPFCGSLKKLNWPLAWARSAELNGRKVFLTANGPGPKRAAEAVDYARWELRGGEVEAVVSMGFCGGLDPALKLGDVFVATSIRVAGVETAIAPPRSKRNYCSGCLLSMDRVAQTAQEKRDLRQSGASAVEMETAGVLSRVREWVMPFYCIRSVTDLADESFRIDLNAVRLRDGRFSTPRILAAAIQRPLTIAPELFELRKRRNIAARSLGEFIADCSF